MNRILTILCIIALAVVFTAPAFAAVQNVKVSGDITVRGISRGDNDLNSSDPSVALRTFGPLGFSLHHAISPAGNADANGVGAGLYETGNQGNNAIVGSSSSNTENFAMSTTRLRVDADLTDNVSTTVGILNQRDWTDTWKTNVNMGAAGEQSSMNVGINLAYVTLKEMLYAPLTVSIGRQDIWFGKGFIIGTNSLTTSDPFGAISADEFGAYTAFDAVRANLNYDPIAIDIVYSKISQGLNENPQLDEASDLIGINTGYKFNQYNAEVEAYYWYYQDKKWSHSDPSDLDADGVIINDIRPGNIEPIDTVHTIGGRGSLDPIANLTIAGEIAGQFGSSWTAQNNAYSSRERIAMSGDISGEYRFVNVTWTPKIGAEYIYYSGEEAPLGNNDSSAALADSTDNAWHPMFRGKFDTAIREFQAGHLHGKAILSGNYMIDDFRATPGFTNEHQVALFGSIKPLSSVKVDGRFTFFWTAEDVKFTNYFNRNQDFTLDSHIGNELDMQVSYNYTEDVTFGLLGAWFFPGDFFSAGHSGRNAQNVANGYVGDTGDRAGGDPFNKKGDNTAAEIIGSVAVVF